MSTGKENGGLVYGLLAEFADAGALVEAARKTREAGYKAVDAFSPYPVPELSEALGLRRFGVPFITLMGAIAGGGGAFFLQYYTAVFDYPFMIGGKPLNSWPMFIPITFELTVLGAGLSAVIGMLALNKLPMPYHPVFNVASFRWASQDRFFLCVEARDPGFEIGKTRRFLEGLGAKEVAEVAA